MKVPSSWEEAQELMGKVTRKSEDFHKNGQFMKEGVGGKIKKWLIVLAVISAVIGVIVTLVSDYGQPWEVMLKQTKSGSNAGFEDKVYPGGVRYLLTPFQEELYHFDTRVKFLHITTVIVHNPNGTYSITPGTGVDIPTTDGSTVYSDITVAYRIYPNSERNEKDELIHGGPNELRLKAGLVKASWEKIILQDAGDRCKRVLGSLTTDDYYNSPLREKKAALATQLLNNGWDDEDGVRYPGWHQHGIDIVSVLIRAYYYLPSMDTAIASKNIQIQERMLNDAKEKKAKNLAKVDKATGEGDAAIATLKNKKAREVEIIVSGGDKYRRIKISDGDRLVGEAEAGAQKLKAEALETSGSKLYIAKELAPLVKNLHGGVVSGMDPFNMGQWMDRFIGKNSN
jgi:hypothetical protein